MQKQLFILAALLSGAALNAQVVNPPLPGLQIQTVLVAPSGSCTNPTIAYLTPAGSLYTCVNGTWALTAGGGAAFPSGTGIVEVTSGVPGLCSSTVPCTITGSGSTTPFTVANGTNTAPGISITGTGPSLSASSTISTAGTITSGVGSGIAGALDLAQGTLPSLGNTAVTLMAPTSVTSYGLLYPGVAPSAGQALVWGTPSSGVSTGAFTAVLTSVATASPITGGPITGTGTISCATCVTSAASLTSLGAMVGAGGQAAQVSAQMIVANLGTAGTETWTLVNTGLATTPAGGFGLSNTTASTAGTTVQVSPPETLCGTAYNSVSVLSETNCWKFYVSPSSQAGTTNGALIIQKSNGGGAYSTAATFTSGGSLVLGNNITANTGTFTGTILTSAAPTVAAAQVGFGSTTAALSNCGAAILTTATACLVFNVAGTTRYIPYF